MKYPRNFNTWMDAVNTALSKKIGITSDDLPDQPYSDWFDDGFTVNEAVNETLASEGIKI